MKRKILGALLAALTASLLVSAPVASAAAPAVTFKAQLTGGNFVWSPNTATITAGQVAAWNNPTTVNHTLDFYTGPWKNVPLQTLTPGKTLQAPARRAGNYSFYCTLHGSLVGGVCSGMCGKLTVQ
jgi:plastocyanin